jgi:hypothetical protein
MTDWRDIVSTIQDYAARHHRRLAPESLRSEPAQQDRTSSAEGTGQYSVTVVT